MRTFNATSTYDGIIQMYEDAIGAQPGDVSGNSIRLAKATAKVNSALDSFWAIAIPASGRWQLDDTNQTDYPIIKTNLVSGQIDYPFTTDGSSNLILDIYKVLILPSATATRYEEIFPIDQQSEEAWFDGISNETGQTGIPLEYDKTANGIFLGPAPSYNATNGLKVFINRTASYFTTSDTTKKPGVPAIFHDYFWLKPAYEYLRNNTATNGRDFKLEVLEMEAKIRDYFADRTKDEPRQLTMKRVNFR